MWLALQNHLLTKDRMLRCGMNVDQNCVLCSTGVENVQHIFEQCLYSTLVFQNACFPLLSLIFKVNVVVGI